MKSRELRKAFGMNRSEWAAALRVDKKDCDQVEECPRLSALVQLHDAMEPEHRPLVAKLSFHQKKNNSQRLRNAITRHDITAVELVAAYKSLFDQFDLAAA